ncbi:MAG: DNA translocase FtsK 4TM domain-containing protein, partial [Acidimicrobiales bacterium]|nr:DNA translocase FtsK 4TM domain-containing protein [Acidimicrobiales bacterium]
MWGLVLLLVAVLFALGIYSGDLAGPVGRLVNRLAGDLFGWARILLPPLLAYLGWTLIREVHPRRGRPPAEDERVRPPVRVTVGAVVVLMAAAGIADRLHGPDRWAGVVARLRGAGGLVGMGVAGPIGAGLGSWGTGLVLAVLVLIGVLVMTATSARQAVVLSAAVLSALARGGVTVVRGVASAPARAERMEAQERHPSAPTGHHSIYDGEADTPPAAAALSRPEPDRPPVSVRLPAPVEAPSDAEEAGGEPEQLSISLGPAAEGGTWRLPPAALLKRSKAAEVNLKQIEALGHTLEDALAAHGVETRLVGMTVGPT